MQNKLEKLAYELRLDVINMIHDSDARAGHFGGSLSAAEIIAVLYEEILRIDPENPKWEERDRLILGKGHAVPIVYAALAEKGFFDKSVLSTYRDEGSILQGHPDKNKTPGLDMSSGSLGQGLSVALGKALAGIMNKKFNVYALLSDGEMQEGMIWEAAMAASHYKADNLIAFVDKNGLQVDGETSDIMNIDPLDKRFEAFGWDTQCIDGHDTRAIYSAVKRAQKIEGKPSVIICNTVKGKGVDFMENSIEWHCSEIDDRQYASAVAQLQSTMMSFGENC